MILLKTLGLSVCADCGNCTCKNLDLSLANDRKIPGKKPLFSSIPNI